MGSSAKGGAGMPDFISNFIFHKDKMLQDIEDKEVLEYIADEDETGLEEFSDFIKRINKDENGNKRYSLDKLKELSGIEKEKLSKLLNDVIPPTRVDLWKLAIAFKLDLDETEKLFNSTGYSIKGMARRFSKNNDVKDTNKGELEEDYTIEMIYRYCVEMGKDINEAKRLIPEKDKKESIY